MLEKISIADYYEQKELLPLIDVRSPGEFLKGHIPNAINIPLFSDEERAKVGTVYKKQSKEKAIELGYRFVEPKLDFFIQESKKVAQGKAVVVHCWRGGMRSQSFATHLHENGFSKVYFVDGGYKAYRNYVLDFFAQSFDLKIIGGYTGSGKTYILKELAQLGEQVIDLEGVAHHKGSAFGALGETPQPSSEYFENILFEQSRHFDLKKRIWIEDESARIGCVQLPKTLFDQMRSQTLYFLNIPKEERAKHLVEDYAKYSQEDLERGVKAIQKRLGGQHTQLALEALSHKDYYKTALITLKYYDKAYEFGLNKRDPNKIVRLEMSTVDALRNAQKLLEITR